MEDIDLRIVDPRPFRSYFYSMLVILLVISLATFLLIQFKYRIIPLLVLSTAASALALPAMLLLSILFNGYQNNYLRKINKLSSFDEKIADYFRFYRLRSTWHLFSCLVLGILGILSARMIFFYFTLIDIFLILPLYPGIHLFRRELNDKEIVLS